jgi:hypothetical protein
MSEIYNNSLHHEKKIQEENFFQRYGSLLLSHHPDCDKFKHHTINIGSFHFCIGCFIGYPTALIFILLFNSFKIYLLIKANVLLLFGVIFLSFFILSPLRLTKHKIVKILQKFFIGIGSAFLFWWIWTLTTDLFLNLFIFSIIFGAIIIFLNGYHAYSFLKVCRTCKYKTNWQNCPGFQGVYNRNKKKT